jgi:hypothetical protein
MMIVIIVVSPDIWDILFTRHWKIEFAIVSIIPFKFLKWGKVNFPRRDVFQL